MWKKYTEEIYLDKRLENYAKNDYYPFHMPGHKRRLDFSLNPYEIDITEIDGFDNLHKPEEILKSAMRRASLLYGAKRSFYLINGSTCGILAAVSSVTKPGGKILMARNCHKAVYHAAYLRRLKTFYLYPPVTSEGIQGSITPRSVEKALKRDPDIEAVIISSPTYDGVVSDIKSIAEAVHRRNIPLIVDEAHGAHFGFHSYFPKSSASLGADLVIQSMHKTLPSLTQTALLHICTDRVDEEKVSRFLGIYETSSPSYVLMAGMDRCVRLMEQRGKILFQNYAAKLSDFYCRAGKLNCLKVSAPLESKDENCFCIDPSKIRISGKECGVGGKKLYDLLLERYRLQMEMYSASYVLAMTSVMDTDGGFERLLNALYETDRQIEKENCNLIQPDFIEDIYGKTEKRLEISDAWEKEKKSIALSDACGFIAADFICLYPPGIPVLVTGEEISSDMIGQLTKCVQMGLNVQGIDGKMRIQVVNSSVIHYTK